MRMFVILINSLLDYWGEIEIEGIVHAMYDLLDVRLYIVH